MFKKMYVCSQTFIFFLSLLSLTLTAGASEMGIPVQLRLRKPDSSYPTETLATVTLRILSNTGCVLRQEEFANQDMTDGFLTLSLGTGNLVSPDPGLSLNAVYNNVTAKTNLTCVNGSNVVIATGQTYAPAATDGRILRVTTTASGDNIIADFNMKSAPYAIQAESVGGKSGVDILTRNSGTQLSQANLESLLVDNTRLTNLLNIATAGQATAAVNFTGNLLGDVTGTQSATVVSKLRGVNLSATVPTLGQVLTYDGSQYVPATPEAAAVLSVNGKTGAVVLTGADIPGLVTSATSILGDVTGNVSATVVSSVGGKSAATIATTVNDMSSATSAATPSTLVKRDGSGNISVNTMSGLNTSIQNVNIYEGTNTNYVRLKAPNSFSNYILTLPVDDGTNGQMLATDGNGNLSWTSGSGVSSYVLKANNLSDLSSASTARTNLGLGGAAILNVGTTAGTVAAGDDSRIVNALSTSTNFSGDISGVYNSLVLANSGVVAGTYGAADKSLSVTTDAKGRVTSVSENSISIVSSQVTNFATTVLGTVLTGFSAATATAVTAADTVLVAIGKLQGQLNTILNPATTMASSSGNLTTASTTDVTMTGMTLTPSAGTYQVYFTTTVSHATNGAVISMELYAGGVALANSQTQTTPRVAVGINNASLTLNQTVIGEVTVNGSQAIDIRWNTSAGTATSVGSRMMVIHRVR